MKIQCEVRNKDETEVLCCSDEAVLCKSCDKKVHAANKLSQRHQRVYLLKHAASSSSSPFGVVPLCDICQERKGYFCLEDRALLCKNCDGSIHMCTSHQRVLVTGGQVSLHSLPQSTLVYTISFKAATHQTPSSTPLSSGKDNKAENKMREAFLLLILIRLLTPNTELSAGTGFQLDGI